MSDKKGVSQLTGIPNATYSQLDGTPYRKFCTLTGAELPTISPLGTIVTGPGSEAQSAPNPSANGAAGLGGIILIILSPLWLSYKFWTYKPKTKTGKKIHNFLRGAYALTLTVGIGGASTYNYVMDYRTANLLDEIKQATKQYGNPDGIIGDLPDMMKIQINNCRILTKTGSSWNYIAPVSGVGGGAYVTRHIGGGKIELVMPDKLHEFSMRENSEMNLCSMIVDYHLFTPRYEHRDAYKSFLEKNGLDVQKPKENNAKYPPITADTNVAYLTEELVSYPWPTKDKPRTHITLPKGTQVLIKPSRDGEVSGVTIPSLLEHGTKFGQIDLKKLTPQKVPLERDRTKWYDVLESKQTSSHTFEQTYRDFSRLPIKGVVTSATYG
ncbi:MAG TPA: hypothetical protein DCY07_04505 [Rhodospirillaceae bacterium]|nr:hypothetical protein [Rhodospirillaceae bacterium]